MAKVTPQDRSSTLKVKVSTKAKGDKETQAYHWFKAKNDAQLLQEVLDTAAFLKEQQQYRYRQASQHARMYGNLPLSNYAGSALSKITQPNQLPVDRPTMNVVQSCIDTLVSRISQSKPRPLFLTDNGKYKQRSLAKQLNSFIAGELYQTDAPAKVETMLRDSATLGTGCLKVFAQDDKVTVERVLLTELLVDQNDAFYGSPRCMYQLKLVDRDVALEAMPSKAKSVLANAEQAYPDNSADAQKTASDQIMMVEAWHLPSGANAKDGRHVIACTAGLILDEPFTKDDFPFVFMHYSPRLIGFWGQGLAEQLVGTQVEINKLLVTISQSISLVGVPRVFVEDGSKVVKAHLNNQVGSIVTYRGTKPQYEVAPCVPEELYAQLQRLVEYAYQQSGVSALAATSQKPAGLNSGEAIRNYDDLQSDRFATLNKRYDAVHIDLSYKIIEVAMDIHEATGSYQTVCPSKDGTQEVDLPAASELVKNPFVIQCFDSSSLPRDPAGRLQKVTEMMQAGIIDPEEGRRLLDYPDLSQDDKLASAAKERIFKQLDNIVDKGESGYEPPDSFTDIQQALKLVSQYYNLYAATDLPESKLELLRNYQAQVLALQQASMPPPMPGMPPGTAGAPGAPQAVPQAPPTSDIMSQVPKSA